MRRVFFFSLCVTVLALSGCTGAFDPFKRPYQWSATGAANKTIAQQVANPADLISGQSEPMSSGVAATGGIDKALTGGTATGLQTAATVVSAAGSN